MIEQALYKHLQEQRALREFLATYGEHGDMAIFNQEAPADRDELWGDGRQYGRIVFAVDLEGDPARIMGGRLSVDIMCRDDDEDYPYAPEDIEPVMRRLIHGYFFSNCTFAVAAQWRNTNYFTEAKNHVIGCTQTFDLLGFPIITTSHPDVIQRINEWTSETFPGLHVINYDELPDCAWKPQGCESAVYWRLVSEAPSGWIPNTFSTIWQTAILKCHIFSEDVATAATVARDIAIRLHAVKRLLKAGETPIMVNRKNTTDNSADPLRTGQLTVEATYGVIMYFEDPNTGTIENINY